MSNLRGRADAGAAPYWLADAGGADLGPIGNPIQSGGYWIMGGAQILGGAFLLLLGLGLFVLVSVGHSKAVRKLAG